ncbi:hypothetical protein ROTAS13_04109 [Roseomonas sp. TAS13]|nr:hypothetical protein ROTAS13_04109 [Roseomonas sp. TAS13]
MTAPKQAFSITWARKKRLRRVVASSSAAVVRCRSPEPTSLMTRSRMSSRYSSRKTTKTATMPVVATGPTRGAITLWISSSVPGSGVWTSTGRGRTEVPASAAGPVEAEEEVEAWGRGTTFSPRRWSRPETRSTMPPLDRCPTFSITAAW